jgi:hypothetical protein
MPSSNFWKRPDVNEAIKEHSGYRRKAYQVAD